MASPHFSFDSFAWRSRSDARGLLAFARACAARDAAAPYPDAESGPTEPPFEAVIAGHAAARGERIGWEYQRAKARGWRRVEEARACLASREQARLAAWTRLAAAEADQVEAVAAVVAAAGDRPRRFAHLAWTVPVRAAIVGVVTVAEAVALKPTLDGLGAPYLHTLLLVAALVFAGLVLAGNLARHVRDHRLAAGRQATSRQPAGRLPRGADWSFLSPGLVAALGVLVTANVFLALIRASTYTGQIQLLGDLGVGLDVGFPAAFGLFLSMQALFAVAVATVEYSTHDPLAAAVRRTGWRARLARAVFLAARHRELRADAAERAAVRDAAATLAALRGAVTRERAWMAIVRDSYRADLVARCDVERAAALAALPRKPWPVPEWVACVDDDVASLTSQLRPSKQEAGPLGPSGVAVPSGVALPVGVGAPRQPGSGPSDQSDGHAGVTAKGDAVNGRVAPR